MIIKRQLPIDKAAWTINVTSTHVILIDTTAVEHTTTILLMVYTTDAIANSSYSQNIMPYQEICTEPFTRLHPQGKAAVVAVCVFCSMSLVLQNSGSGESHSSS